MTDQEFRDLWLEATREVAERFYPSYPRGKNEGRDDYFRDQAMLYLEIVKRLSAHGHLGKG